MDTLLDMVRMMRLTGGVFLEAEFSEPWCIASQIVPEDCAPFMPVPRHIIGYHYVVSGRCVLKVIDQQPEPVESGQLIVLTRNDAHLIASAIDVPPVNAHELIQPAPQGGLLRIVHGGGGQATQILCGFLANDLPCNPLIALLPCALKVDVAEGAAADWIENNLRYAARELAEGRTSSPPILGKLAELLFMETVRRYFTAQPALERTLRAGIHDPIVGRALELIHTHMARRWTTEELAQEIASSRSAFAERFARTIGEPPMRYLARQRLAQASMRLRESADPIARIANAVGYESEVAFNRAFRREFGIPPAAWRRKHRPAPHGMTLHAGQSLEH